MEWWESSLTAPVWVVVAVVAGALVVLVVLVVLWALSARRRRRIRRESLALQQDLLDVELGLAEQGARLRMVGELLDVAISSVQTTIGHADGARYKAESDPAATGRAVAAIGDSARSTLAELRRVVTVVRQGEAESLPQPGIRTARELFRVMREAGLDIRFEESGERFGLRHNAEVAVFRILQEALSNAVKYGGEGTEVRVSFRWSDDGLNVLIDDDGIRAATRRAGEDPNRVARAGGYTVEDDAAALTVTPEGPGITEMRERAELFGGTFTAYTVPGVGFSVAAAFPQLRHVQGVSTTDGA